MKRIQIELGGLWVENPVTYLPGVIGAATLFEDKAPKICEALWKALPIETRTIHAYNAGQTWRTEKNFPLVPAGVVENFHETFEPGNLVYLNFPEGPLFKIFLVYGAAKVPVQAKSSMSIIGKVDENLEWLVNMSRRILYEGPKNIAFRRIE